MPDLKFITWHNCIRGCIQKFPDWPPRTRIANDEVLCH